MNANEKAARNLTAYGQPFNPDSTNPRTPWSAPDALIHALSGYMTEKLFAYSSMPDHFVQAGFSDADLVIGEQLPLYASMGWMNQVLQWDPTAKAGEHGAWTWAPPQPTISDRLRVALYVLGIERENVDGVFRVGAHALAQRSLNELLLAHPVLMHPRVRVDIGVALGLKSGTCSVAHAIALTPNAHFPMPSDWPAGQAPMNELRAFANCAVVQRVLLDATKSIPHRGELEATKGRSYFTAATRLTQARPGLLRSLYDLGRLMTPNPGHHPGVGLILADWGTTKRPEGAAHQASVLADSFFSACGVMNGRRNREQSTLYRQDSFFEFIRALDDDDREDLPHAMRGQLFNAIFGVDRPSHNTDEVEYNLRAVLSGMAKSGLLDGTEASAALWVRHQLKDVGRPVVEPAAALGFIRVMRSFGLELLPEHFRVFKSAGVVVPLEEGAPGWAEALSVDVAERAMREVLDRAPPPVVSNQSNQSDHPSDQVVATRRRARAGV